MKTGFIICPEILHFFMDQLDQPAENLLCGIAEKLVFHGRLSDNDRRINRISPVSYRPEMEDREFRGGGIMSEMIAEGTFHPSRAGGHYAFQNALRLSS